jgi:hypothetical protein
VGCQIRSRLEADLAALHFSEAGPAVCTGSVTMDTRANVARSVSLSGSALTIQGGGETFTIQVEAAAGG